MVADYFLKNPRMLLLVASTIIAIGVSSIVVMPRLEDPILRKRLGVVTIVLPGASAEEIEAAVARTIEQRLVGVAEIARVRSSSSAESCNIVIELADEVTDVDTEWAKVRSALQDIDAALPTDALVSTLDVLPLKAYASLVAIISGDDDAMELAALDELAKELQTEILKLPGTETVDLFGRPEFEILVDLEPRNIASNNVTVGQLASAIADQQQLQPQSAVYTGSEKQLVGVGQSTDLLDRIRETLIWLPSTGKTVSLQDLASVTRSTRLPVKSKAIIDGQQAIVLGALVKNSVRLDRWDDGLEEAIVHINERYAGQATAKRIFSQRLHIDTRLRGLLQNLALTTVLVIVVTSIMMGWRASLVVVTSLPLAACLVLGGLRWMSIPIHQMSVTGLIVSLGLLIDNAIVVVEDIRGRRELGQSIRSAMLRSIVHLRFPLIASTLTTALAFMPLAIMIGPAGEFVGSLAISVILAISCSLLLALTWIPAVFGLLDGNIAETKRGSRGLRVRWIERSTEWLLGQLYRRPLVGVLLSAALPAIGFQQASQLPRQFFPPSDRAQIQIEVVADPGSSLERVEKAVHPLAQIIAEDERLQTQNWFFGHSAPSFYYNVVPRRRNTEFYAQAFVDLAAKNDAAGIVRELQEKFDKVALDYKVLVRLLQQGPPFDAPVEIRLVGSELDQLQTLGAELRRILEGCAHVKHTQNELSETISQTKFELDEEVASESGLTATDVARYIFANTSGLNVEKIFDSEEEVLVRVKTALDMDAPFDELLALPVPAPRRGPPINNDQPIAGPPKYPSLGSLGQFQSVSTPASIVRMDGSRVSEVKAYIQAGVLPSDVLEQFREQLDKNGFELPPGYRMEIGGESEKRDEAVQKLMANAVVLFALILLTLVAAFSSFKAAVVIAGVGSLTIGLGPLSLFLFSQTFGFMAIVGTMGLVGIAINDSIVVLAAIYEAAPEKQLNSKALAKIVMSCSRHVLTTTVTTIVGFLPLVLFGGAFWRPLALTICVGITGATLMAFLFTPGLHRLMVKH